MKAGTVILIILAVVILAVLVYSMTKPVSAGVPVPTQPTKTSLFDTLSLNFGGGGKKNNQPNNDDLYDDEGNFDWDNAFNK